MVELALSQSINMKRNWNDHVEGLTGRKLVDDETGQRVGQRYFSPIFEQMKGLAERGDIGIQRPGLGKGWRPLSTGPADLMGGMGGGGGRNERIAAAAAACGWQGGNSIPARRAKIGNGIVSQRNATGRATDRE